MIADHNNTFSLRPNRLDGCYNERDTEYLWIRDPRLALLEKVLESKTNNWLNQLEVEFVEISKQKRLDELEETKRQLHISEERRLKAELREKATRVENLLEQQPLNSLVLAIHSIGLNLDKLPKDTIDLVQTRLLQVAETVRIQNAFLGHTGDVNSVALSPDGQIIVSGSDDGTIRLWDIQGNPISQPFTVNTAVNSVAFSPDGQMIVSGSSDKTVRLWDIQGNLLGQPFVGHNAAVNSVAFSPDGQIIASGSDDQTTRLWNILNSTKNFLQKAVSTVQNQWLKVSSNAHIQDLMDQPFIGHKAAVNSVAFSPDGQIIASASDDQTIRLWDIQGNLIGQPLVGHYYSINSVAFSPDGQMIASGDGFRTGGTVIFPFTVRLWDLQGNPIGQPFTGHSDAVCCNRLRYHPIFKNPQTEIEKSACETCQKYVWNSYAVQLNELGAAKQKEKAFQAAIEDFNQALQFNPNHTNTYYTRGICYASLKNYQEAINDFNQAINFEKEYASAYYYRGMCHLKLNKHNKAIEDFQKAADFYEKQEQKDRYQDALDYIKRLQS